MKILVAEDEFVSRKLIHSYLRAFGECDFASDGKEAVRAFEEALTSGEPYQLICLDVKMPELSGLDALKLIRATEERTGIGGLDGAKIIMTTGVMDSAMVLGSFKAGCEAYVIKPLDRQKFYQQLKNLGFSPKAEATAS